MDKNGDHLILERAHNTMFEFMDQIEKNKEITMKTRRRKGTDVFLFSMISTKFAF
jgi:hypothetical protein